MILNILNNKKGRVICLFFVSVFSACGVPEKQQTEFKLEGNALGTTYHITYLGDEFPSCSEGVDSILKEFNYALSTYHKTSLISAFNNNEFPFQDWPEDLTKQAALRKLNHMIEVSKVIERQTHGTFNPAAANLFALYSAAKKSSVLMDEFKVSELLPHQNIQSIKISNEGIPEKLLKDSAMKINFNAIAKGYFVDVLAEYLESLGSKNYMVEVGGEVHCSGINRNKTAWKIGINKPVIGADPTDFFEVISLSNQSMATSGNYQNYYIVDGKVIGHTLDPRSGKPVISDLKSATIIHKECAVADAYATACMVMGLEESTNLIEADSSLTAFFIYEENGQLKGRHVK